MNGVVRGLMIATGAVTGFAASAYLVAAAKSPSGYIHDEAYLFIMGVLPVGGWGGAFMAWTMARLTLRNNKLPVSAVGSLGCLGAIGAWVLIVVFMRLVGVKGD